MRQRHRGHLLRGLLSLLPGVLLVSTARAQVIFIDPCGITIPPQTFGQLTIWVCVEGRILEGITSAQFRIDGLPNGWQASVTPVGAAVSSGELFGDGVNVGFPACANGVPYGPGRYLALFGVLVFAADASRDVVLAVTTKNPPTDPSFDCALVTLCDDPAFTKVCVGNHGAIVNPEFRHCGLPVEGGSWSKVKAIYR